MSWISKAWKKSGIGKTFGGDGGGGGYDYNPVGYTPGTAQYQQPTAYQPTQYTPTAQYQAIQPGQAAQYQGTPLGMAAQYQVGQYTPSSYTKYGAYNPYESQLGTSYEANLNQMMSGKLSPAEEQMLNNRLKQNMAALNEGAYGMPGGVQAGLAAQTAQENALQGSLLGLQQKNTAMGQIQPYLGYKAGEGRYAYDTGAGENRYAQDFARGENQFGYGAGAQERQFGATLGEQQRQFGANYGAQQGQFGATLGEQQRQYNANLVAQQGQFGYGQNVQQNQFGANLAAQQGQFGYNADLANRQYQFENTRDEERRAQDWAQRQRELDAQYASLADQRAAQTSQGIWSTLGNVGGMALGGYLGRG